MVCVFLVQFISSIVIYTKYHNNVNVQSCNENDIRSNILYVMSFYVHCSGVISLLIGFFGLLYLLRKCYTYVKKY